jgi:hypothetical protein
MSDDDNDNDNNNDGPSSPKSPTPIPICNLDQPNNHESIDDGVITDTLTSFLSPQPPIPPSISTSTANDRLTQVASHLAPPEPSSKPSTTTTTQPRRRTRQKTASSDLPADYSDILGQVETLKAIAAKPDPENRGYVRQKKAGKLWVRERVTAFVDPGTFREVGSVSGTVKWRKIGEEREEPESYVPSNNVQGFGRLKGRPVVFTADDYSIRAGHADGSLAAKTVSVGGVCYILAALGWRVFCADWLLLFSNIWRSSRCP